MSLYRTWRPLTFADLVGQDAVVRTLTVAIESGKLAHAYLFSGPRGSGKTSAAKILARCINCENGPTANPDNTCENCRSILAGTALDVLEIDAASNRGIDEIRALREAVKFAPATMRMKVYIIDEAHMLTKEGANAFLKTLEEPPPHAVFILATTEPDRLPVTILSRCQRYAFRRIAVPIMIDKMKEIATAERISVDDEALAAIAYRADGGLRDALTMLEQLAAFAGGERATVSTLDLAFGSTGRKFAHALVDAIVARESPAALAIVEEASDSGADLHVLMRTLIAAFRNLLVARIDPALLSRDLAAEDAARLARQAQGVSQAIILRALRTFGDALSLARSGGNPRIELETALLRLILATDDPASEALTARVAALEERLGLIAVPAAKASPPPSTKQGNAANPSSLATSGISVQKVRAAWQSIRGKVESERQTLSAPLSRAVIDAVESNAIVLKLPNAWSAEALKDHASLIEAAILDVLGVPLKLRLRVDASARAAATSEETPDELFDYANERIR
ncbi:MAG: DNA polymerase III subunit gamma/tau [Candidatus Eremiobacteraeota bacterium]|nr:DNA polymerase III subunit gamma/tau [Candidatus Eremiobacteraeota bacterium]